MSNRKLVRTDDAMKDSKETATDFNVSQTSHNSKTKLNLLIHKSKSKRTWLELSLYLEAVSFCHIAIVEQLPLSSYS